MEAMIREHAIDASAVNLDEQEISQYKSLLKTEHLRKQHLKQFLGRKSAIDAGLRDGCQEIEAQEQRVLQEADYISSSINDVTASLETARTFIERSREDPTNTDFDALETRLKLIDNLLKDTRQAWIEKLEIINTEQKDLHQAVQYLFKTRLPMWERRPIIDDHENKIRKSKTNILHIDKEHSNVTTEKGLPEAVAVFDKYAADHGPYGGWTITDHQVYLHFQPKTPSSSELSASITSKLSYALPHHTNESIRQHHTWHLKYQHLLQARKEAMNQWREERAQSKYQAQMRQDLKVSQLENAEAEERLEREKREKKRREKVKADLEKWKETKLSQEALTKEQEEEEAHQKQQLKKEDPERLQLKAQAIKEYKAAKEEANRRQEEQVERELAEKREALKSQWKELKQTGHLQKQREKDLRHATAHSTHTVQLQARLSEQARLAHLSLLAEQGTRQILTQEVKKDFERVVQPTKSVAARKEGKGDEAEVEGSKWRRQGLSFATGSVGGRAVPSWRSGL